MLLGLVAFATVVRVANSIDVRARVRRALSAAIASAAEVLWACELAVSSAFCMEALGAVES